MKTALTSFAALALGTTAIFAQDRFEMPVTGDVLPGWVQSDGSRIAALRVDLAPGWKTYWRAPGDAGIPPRFDWSGSRNLHSVAVNWPAPKVFDQNGYRSVGYENTLIIPLHIEATQSGAPIQLNAQMELGICSDICIPHEMEFSAVIDGAQRTPTPSIAAALAAQPYSASEAGVDSAECRVRPTSDGLQIEARITMPSAGGEEYVVIESGLDDVWVSEANTSRTGGTVTAVSEMAHVNGGPIALDRSNVRITVLGDSYAVDVRGCTAG
ncbi:MAG: protein-disulfide reductase DsbD domain-containing protein [Pseudomonadota bacterium]